MSKTRDRKRFIIVDVDYKPMAWHEGSKQLCYTPTRGLSRFFLKIYSEKEAKEVINKTKRNRKRWNMFDPSSDNYYLIPVHL